ncbi:hypothetical protein STXM2123_5222 [Streptomyces sp. F-3]|nr:hypothetical protein STXM2123_5222 [Streptomyces sp. F-3]
MDKEGDTDDRSGSAPVVCGRCAAEAPLMCCRGAAPVAAREPPVMRR